MKKKVLIIILALLTIIALIIGLIFMNKNVALRKNNIEIIDATFSCSGSKEKIYEDNKYVYYLPCQKSNSVFVKFKDSNSKILIRTAIEEDRVTIDELLKAGLDAIKENK